MHGNGSHRRDSAEANHARHKGMDSPTTSPSDLVAQRRHEKWLMGSMVAATVCLVAAIGPGFANSTLDDHPVQRWVQPLPLPEPETIATDTHDHAHDAADVATAPTPSEWRVVEIKPGSTLRV